jgi:hypothetical protein
MLLATLPNARSSDFEGTPSPWPHQVVRVTLHEFRIYVGVKVRV